MSQTSRTGHSPKPERPSPMMETERALSLKEQFALIAPRWAKRLFRVRSSP